MAKTAKKTKEVKQKTKINNKSRIKKVDPVKKVISRVTKPRTRQSEFFKPVKPIETLTDDQDTIVQKSEEKDNVIGSQEVKKDKKTANVDKPFTSLKQKPKNKNTKTEESEKSPSQNLSKKITANVNASKINKKDTQPSKSELLKRPKDEKQELPKKNENIKVKLKPGKSEISPKKKDEEKKGNQSKDVTKEKDKGYIETSKDTGKTNKADLQVVAKNESEKTKDKKQTEENVAKERVKSVGQKNINKPRITRNAMGRKEKKSPTDMYKNRHNIGKRVAAGRVCSYKETEISLVFPDNYWGIPSCKVDFTLSSSESSSGNSMSSGKSEASSKSESSESEMSEDNEVQFNFEAQKKRAEVSTDLPKKSIEKSPELKACAKKKISHSLSLSNRNVNKRKRENQKGNTGNFQSKHPSKKEKMGNVKSGKAGKSIKVKKRKSKFDDIRPRAPRIQRTACLNASAINSLMYDYSAPPKKIKMEEMSDKNIKEQSESKEVTTTDDDDDDYPSDNSDSNYSDEEDDNEKGAKGNSTSKITKVSPWKKVGKGTNKTSHRYEKKKSQSQQNAKKALAKSKKKAIKRRNQEKLELLMQPLPKRMASLNAQAIMAACKELDEMKIPVEPKLPKESRLSKDNSRSNKSNDGEIPQSETRQYDNTENKFIKCESQEKLNKSLGKSPVKSPPKMGKSSINQNNSNLNREDLVKYTEMRIQSNIGRFEAVEDNLVNRRHFTDGNNASSITSQEGMNSTDPYEFVDVVDDDSKLTASRPLNASQALKIQVSSPEIVVDSPANSPPKTVVCSYQASFQPLRPSVPTPKPTPQYPVQFHMQQQSQPPAVSHHAQAPFHQSGFRASFHQHPQPGQSTIHPARGISSSAASSLSVPTQLPHSSSHSPFQQPTSQSYIPPSTQPLVTRLPQTSAFQASNHGAFAPTLPPVQLVPAYPPTSFSQHPSVKSPYDPPLPANLPPQSGAMSAPPLHNPLHQQQRETSTSSGRSSVSSLTDQATPPGGQAYNQAHRSTSLGNTATYPYPHGRNSTQSSTHPGSNTAVGGGGGHGHCQSYMQHSGGLRGMENYPAAGYPIMAYHPKHYSHPASAMFGGAAYPNSHGNSASVQGQGRPGSASSGIGGTGVGSQNQGQSGGPQNLYVGYGYYQPAGPLLQSSHNPFHMLQQQHMKGLFAPAIAHSNSPFSSPQDMMLFPGKAAFQDHLAKRSPSKKGKASSVSSTPEKTKSKIDVLDLSIEHKPHPVIPKAVANLQKSESKKSGNTSSSGGEEQSSPEKQTKDILDLDSKKVKVHRGAVGETDRNSPLKVPRSVGSKKSKSDDGTGFPVQTYKFEARPGGTQMSQSSNFMHMTTIESSFSHMAMPVHTVDMKRTIQSKYAETKTVAANMAIPFYSKPLSVQTSAAGNANAENMMLMGRDVTSNVKIIQKSPEKSTASANKRKSSQSSNPGISQTKRDIVNPGIGLPITQMVTKPIMPVLPLPSVPHHHQQQHRPLVQPITSLSVPVVTHAATSTISTSHDGSQSSKIPNTVVHSVDVKLKPKGGEKSRGQLVSSSVVSSGISDVLDKKVLKDKVEAAAKCPVRSVEMVSNVNSARGVLEGKKSSRKESQKSDAKTPKKDSSKGKDSPKSSTKSDSLKYKTDSGLKTTTPKSKQDNLKQKSKVLESPKHKSHESPRYKMSESPKQKSLESPKQKSTESPKQKADINKSKSDSAKLPKNDSRNIKSDSPRQKSEAKTKLDFTTKSPKFETPKKKDEFGSSKQGTSSAKKERRRSIEEKKFSPGNGNRRRIQSAPPVVHSGWKWEGQPELKPISVQGETPVLRKCYPAVRHDDGDIVSLRDCVLVKSGPRKKDIPFVAKVAALWEHAPYGEMMMSVLWYYRPEQTEIERLPKRERCEIFASRHRDVIPVACIDDKAYVLTFNEYCRFKSEQKRVIESGQGRSTIIPVPAEGSNPLPPLNAPAETVYLCRRVYDVKLKRMLKNPQANYMYSSPNSSKSHTPTPSKSPSPKSASPVVAKHHQQSQSQQASSTLEHNMDIIKAITTLSQLTGGLGATGSMEMPQTWGLPVASSPDIMGSTSHQIHQDVVSSTGSTSSSIVAKGLEKGKLRFLSSASTFSQQRLIPSGGIKFMPYRVPIFPKPILHDEQKGSVSSTSSTHVLPIKSDFSVEDKKPEGLAQYFTSRASTVNDNLESKASLVLPTTTNEPSSVITDNQKNKAIDEKVDIRIDTNIDSADKANSILVTSTQDVTTRNVKSELIVEEQAIPCIQSKEQGPINLNKEASTSDLNINTAADIQKGEQDNEKSKHSPCSESIYQPASKKGLFKQMNKESNTPQPANDSIMDIDEDDASGELVMDLDAVVSDSEHEVQGVTSSSVPSQHLAQSIPLISTTSNVVSDVKERVATSVNVIRQILPEITGEVNEAESATTSKKDDGENTSTSIDISKEKDPNNMVSSSLTIATNKLEVGSKDTACQKAIKALPFTETRNEVHVKKESDIVTSSKDVDILKYDAKVQEKDYSGDFNISKESLVIDESDQSDNKGSLVIDESECSVSKGSLVIDESENSVSKGSLVIDESDSSVSKGPLVIDESDNFNNKESEMIGESKSSESKMIKDCEMKETSREESPECARHDACEQDKKVVDTSLLLSSESFKEPLILPIKSLEEESKSDSSACTSTKSVLEDTIYEQQIEQQISSGITEMTHKDTKEDIPSDIIAPIIDDTEFSPVANSSIILDESKSSVTDNRTDDHVIEASINDTQDGSVKDTDNKEVHEPTSSATEAMSGIVTKSTLREGVKCMNNDLHAIGIESREKVNEQLSEVQTKESLSMVALGSGEKSLVLDSETKPTEPNSEQLSKVQLPPLKLAPESTEISEVVSEEQSSVKKDEASQCGGSLPSKDHDKIDSDSLAATPSLLILEKMSEEVSKELNTEKLGQGPKPLSTTSIDEKQDAFNASDIVIQPDQTDVHHNLDKSVKSELPNTSSGSGSGGNLTEEMNISEKNDLVKSVCSQDSSSSNPVIKQNSLVQHSSFVEECSNDASNHSVDSEVLTSESSTEVPGDAPNLGEIIGAEITFGSSVGDDSNIPIQILTNETSSSNVKCSDLGEPSMSSSPNSSVQVNNISTTLPNLASQNITAKLESPSISTSETVIPEEASDSVLQLKGGCSKDEVNLEDNRENTQSKAVAANESCAVVTSSDRNSLPVEEETQKSNALVPNTETKSDSETGKPSISSTSSLSLSPIASRMVTSGLKSPNASTSGVSRIEQIVSQIKMAGLGATTSACSDNTTSSSQVVCSSKTGNSSADSATVDQSIVLQSNENMDKSKSITENK